MNQEKFVTQYIELMNATISEAIQKNLVLQAQKRIIEIDIEDIKNVLSERDTEIKNLKQQLNDSRRESAVLGSEREELRKSILHVDTFKNELLRTRTEIDELKAALEKKQVEIDSLKNVTTKQEEKLVENLQEKEPQNTWVKKLPAKKKANKETTIKDAGKF